MTSYKGRDFLDRSELYRFVYYGEQPQVSKEINPDKDTALTALKSWYKEHTNKEILPYQALDSDQNHRFKYRVSKVREIEQYMPNEATYLVWSLYLKLIPKHVRDILIPVLQYTNLCDKERLANLGMIYKKYQHLLNNNWMYFVDLETLGDYMSNLTPEQMYERVKIWLGTKRQHELPDFDFYELYRFGCDAFFSQTIKPFNKPELTISQFLSDPMYWATTGSSDGKRLFDKTGNFKAKKSKWATAVASSLTELISLFYSTRSQILRASVKRELAKARMIISGDLPNYLRMSYISYWLENVLRDHPHTTLFYNKMQMQKMWEDMISNTVPLDREINMINDQPNMTLDESKFDHEVDSKMLTITLESIETVISEFAPTSMKEMLLEAMTLVKNSIIDNGVVVIRDKKDKKLVYINNGIASGWRWTALLDTISNIAKVFAFRLVLVLRNSTDINDVNLDAIKDFTSQGDDLRSRTRSYLHAELFQKLYTEAGFQVHPKKFFVSKYADEFLRKVALYGKTLTGYPARGVSTLVFRNPIREKPMPQEERLKEMASNWLLIGRRCQTEQTILESHMIRDISRANSLSKQIINDYIHAYSNRGGLGLTPNNTKYINIQKAKYISPHKVEVASISKVLFPDNVEAQYYITDKYLSGVSWSKSRKLEQPFKITVHDDKYHEDIDILHYNNTEPYSNRIILVDGPIPKFGLSPSIVDYYKQETLNARYKDIRSQAIKWMDEPSVAFFDHMLKSSNLNITKDWIQAKLIANVPESFIQGPIYVATLYTQIARSRLASVLSKSRITRNKIAKALFKAELQVQQMCADNVIKILE